LVATHDHLFFSGGFYAKTNQLNAKVRNEGQRGIVWVISRSIAQVRSCRIAFYMCLYSLLTGNANEACTDMV
jgi:hypothetical protein